jgi:hypothetical protein
MKGEWKPTACKVPYGWGFMESSSANFSCKVESIELLSEASLNKACFFPSIIFLSAWVCV